MADITPGHVRKFLAAGWWPNGRTVPGSSDFAKAYLAEHERAEHLAARVAELEAAAAPVEWRDGVPSVEAVLAHEARGGLWLFHRSNAPRGINGEWGWCEHIYIGPHHVTGSDVVIDVHGDYAEVPRGSKCRPVAPDGTPVPWPDTEPAAVDEAITLDIDLDRAFDGGDGGDCEGVGDA